MTEGEAISKHIGIINVYRDGSFKMEYVRLATPREIVVREMDYILFKEADGLSQSKSDKEILQSIKDCVLEMIEEGN